MMTVRAFQRAWRGRRLVRQLRAAPSFDAVMALRAPSMEVVADLLGVACGEMPPRLFMSAYAIARWPARVFNGAEGTPEARALYLSARGIAGGPAHGGWAVPRLREYVARMDAWQAADRPRVAARLERALAQVMSMTSSEPKVTAAVVARLRAALAPPVASA